MKIPDSITVKVIDDEERPVAKILVFVNYILEGHNSVTLQKVTESNGEFRIKKSDFIQELRQLRKLFLMDYKGDERDFNGKIEIAIEDMPLLNERVDGIKEFYPEIAENLEESISKVNNKNYLPIKKTIDLSCVESVATIVCRAKTML